MQAANTPSPFRLGIDFGTSHTTAILRWPDGHARPLLIDGSPLLPSAIYAEPGGHLLVGRDAIHAARLDPARFEPTPKRRVSEQHTAGAGETATVHLGDQAVEVTAMVAAVLSRVKDEAVRVSGVQPAAFSVTVTHPAAWGPDRTKTLTDAAARAGLPEPRLVPEPVAAAGYFSAVLGRTIAPGSAVVVYDFGGGTFDASVVSPAEDGYVVLAVDGLPDVGGVDLDAALFQHVAAAQRDADPAIWQRLEEPTTAADRRHRRHLIEDIRTAKEMLSRAESAAVPLPLLEREARITRAEFEELARPLIERTVRLTVDVVAAANLQPGRIAAVLLVGGSSRIPLISRLLREQTKLEPATMDQPETVVAEGSVRLATGGTGDTRAGSVIPAAPRQPSPPQRDATPADPWATVPSRPEAVAPASTVAQAPGANPPPAVNPAALAASAPAAGPAPQPPAAAPAGTAPPPQAFAAGVASPYQGPATKPYEAVPHQQKPPHQPSGYQSSPYAPSYHDPAYQGPAYQDPAYQGPAYQGPAYQAVKRRRRWPVVLTALLAVLIVGAGAVVAVPGLLPAGLLPDGLPFDLGAETTPTQTPAPYVRADPPAWVPADFVQVVDDETTPMFLDGLANPTGECEYLSPGYLEISRAGRGVTACRSGEALKQIAVTDGAVEAELRVRAGCGGLWMRTGAKGYFVAACRDGTVNLHRLGDFDPDEQNRLGQWRPAFDPEKVVVGLLAEATTLTVYVDGQPQAQIVDAEIASGKITVGGFGPSDGVNVILHQYRAWRLP